MIGIILYITNEPFDLKMKLINLLQRVSILSIKGLCYALHRNTTECDEMN